LLGWCASLWITPHAQTGWIASAGFLALGAAWIAATGLAVRFILRGDALSHRRWMIRSFALTAAAITLRMYLPLVFVFHWPFSIAYPAVAWLCWIPNALAVEVYLRFVPTPSRLTLPAAWSTLNAAAGNANLPIGGLDDGGRTTFNTAAGSN
jgi:hypothetical protein